MYGSEMEDYKSERKNILRPGIFNVEELVDGALKIDSEAFRLQVSSVILKGLQATQKRFEEKAKELDNKIEETRKQLNTIKTILAEITAQNILVITNQEEIKKSFKENKTTINALREQAEQYYTKYWSGW